MKLSQIPLRSTCAGLAFALVLAGCGSDGGAEGDGPVKIGVLTTLSGPQSAPGIEIRQGIELAAARIGKSLDRPVKLVVEDTAFNPETAVAKAQKLVNEDEVVAIVGVYASSEMLALNGISERLGVPIVTTNTGATEITGTECSPLTFRVNPNDSMSAAAAGLAFEANAELGDRKWYAVGSDYAWGYSQVKALKGTGAEVVGEEFVATDVTDFGNVISNIQSAKPTAIWGAVLTGTPLLQFLVQLRDFGVGEETVIVAPVGMPEAVMNEAPKATLGVLSAGRWGAWTYEDENPELAEVNADYYEEHKVTPGFQMLNAYMGAEVLFEAIERAGSTESDDIVEALEAKEPFPTIYGDLTMGPEDHQLRTPVFYGTVQELDEPKYGATVGFQIEEVFPGDETVPELTCEL